MRLFPTFGSIFLQHLLNVSHFHNLLSSRPPLDLIMSLIRRRYNGLQGEVQGHGAALTTISHRPHHMCQTAMFGLGSPRPVAPRSKTIRHILPLLPRRARLRQPSGPAARLLRPGHVGTCVGAHPVPGRDACVCVCAWSRVCLGGRASGEGKRTFTHACISGNPLSPM